MTRADSSPTATPGQRVVLTVDCGNTTLDCALGRGGETERRLRLAPGATGELADWLGGGVDVAVGCTVVEGGLAAVAALLARRGVRLQTAGVDLRCPLELRYRPPGALGADRWVAALAACRGWGDAVVIDCGTAATVDVVSGAGVFLGGAILPGAATMAVGLAARAPALPAVDPGAAAGLPGSSVEAVSAGVVRGFCGAVDHLASELAGLAGVPGARRVVTGGEADLLRRHVDWPAEWVPDLVHRGLRLLAG